MSTSKRKKAEREAQHRKEKVQRQYQKMLDNANKKRTMSKNDFVEYKPNETYRRETPDYPSLSSAPIPGAGTKRESQQYTGDYLIGIATMHKSNMVPVSRGIDPTEFATMRRN